MHAQIKYTTSHAPHTHAHQTRGRTTPTHEQPMHLRTACAQQIYKHPCAQTTAGSTANSANTLTHTHAHFRTQCCCKLCEHMNQRMSAVAGQQQSNSIDRASSSNRASAATTMCYNCGRATKWNTAGPCTRATISLTGMKTHRLQDSHVVALVPAVVLAVATTLAPAVALRVMAVLALAVASCPSSRPCRSRPCPNSAPLLKGRPCHHHPSPNCCRQCLQQC